MVLCIKKQKNKQKPSNFVTSCHVLACLITEQNSVKAYLFFNSILPIFVDKFVLICEKTWKRFILSLHTPSLLVGNCIKTVPSLYKFFLVEAKIVQ